MSEYKEFDPKARKQFQKEMDNYRVVPEIKAKGYPVDLEGYKGAHQAANKHERKKFGNRRFNALQKVIEKRLKVGELAGSHTKKGEIIVSGKIPEKYHGQIAEHERFEHKKMEGRKRIIRKRKRIRSRR